MPDFPTSDPHGARGIDPTEAERRRQAALEEELAAARLKRDRYQALLKELPEVFEGKFKERVRPLQERNQQLIDEGEALREQIRRTLPAAAAAPQAALTPAAPSHSGIAAEADRGSGTAAAEGAPVATGAAAPLWRWRAVAAGAGAATLLLLAGRLLLPGPAPQAPTASTPAAPSSAAGASTASTAAPSPAAARDPQTAAATTARQPNTTPVPAGMVRIRSSGPSWVEVESADQALLFTGELNGQRQFALGRGLRIRSGRADLVTIQRANQPERRLGGVEMLDWVGLPAAAPASP